MSPIQFTFPYFTMSYIVIINIYQLLKDKNWYLSHIGIIILSWYDDDNFLKSTLVIQACCLGVVSKRIAWAPE